MRLKKERNYVDSDLKRRDAASPSHAGTNKRKEDGFQVGARGGIRKYAGGERRPVDAAVGGEDVPAEARGNGRHGGAVRRLQFVDNVVGVKNMNAKFPEELGKQALAAGDSACQGNSHDQLLGGGRSDASLGLFWRTRVVACAKGNLATTRIHETRRDEDEQVTLVRPLAAAAEEASDIRNVA